MRPWLLLALAFAAGACTSESNDHAPIARIDVTPGAIPEHDDFQTDVVLDGTRSGDPIDDPDGGLPLAYTWDISGDDMRVQQGTFASSRLTVRFQGLRPATIRLTVTDTTGLSGTARVQMRLTIM
ncbi:MAG TPA: hypothetical protein VKE22_21155 [Haliangiales bacterium]|nr:hypothetical protein [Haliangiales bacterium]